MALSDYVPSFGDTNISTYYRNVLGVPIRKRIVIAVLTVFALLMIFVCGLILTKAEDRRKYDAFPISNVYVPFKNSINASVDPCTNFYEFTCGMWSKSEASKSNKYRVTTFELLQEFIDEKKLVIFENAHESDDFPRVVNDAIGFYNFCISQEMTNQFDLQLLKSYLNDSLGGWPILDPDNWDEDNFDWIQASASLMRTLNIETISEMYSILDDTNTSQTVLYLKSPVFQEDTLLQTASTVPQMIYAVLIALSDHELQSNISDHIDNIMKSQAEWKKIFVSSPIKPSQITLTFQQLQEKTQGFNWLYYIKLIMNETLNEWNKHISEEDVVVIDNFDAIKSAVDFFNSGTLSKQETANLFGWLVFDKIWFLIPAVFKKYADMFGYDLEETKIAKRENCLDIVLELYESSIDFLYIKNSSLSCISDGETLVTYLKNALEQSLSSSSWLDNSTKSAASLKLNAMRSVIGFEPYLTNKTEFDYIFSDFPPVTSNILQTYFNIKMYYVSCLVSVLASNDKLNYIMPRSVTDVSAYYAVQKNVFTLPLSMYNPPFFHDRGPWYLNFGALGSIIGHEIMHGFDKTGCQRSETGNLKNWWTNASAETFEKHANCFSEQYSSYLDTSFKSKYGDRTLDEDIADSEGLRLAYLAYQHWVQDIGSEQFYTILRKQYSPEQMFFISFGSVWCSKIDSKFQFRLLNDRHNFPKWRVNGAVSNSEFFSVAFNCPKGSPMNPEEKCVIW